MSRLLLCTDLDRTLIPNGNEPESPGARELLARLVSHPRVRLVYVTGRDMGLVEEAVDQWQLPAPDLVIADVGTSILRPMSGRWERWAGWDATLASSWLGMKTADLQERLAEIVELRPQETSRQGKFKLSYYTEPGAQGGMVVARAAERLERIGVQANLIWSEDEEAGQGLLDILPQKASKRLAVEFLLKAWNFAPEETVFSGDSGNDLDLLASPVPAVLVANATAEVREQARRLAADAGQQEKLYFAQGGVLGMNGNYAAGILEGVLHFQPEWRECLGDLS
jgi:sucrose-6F-phosphate phosphohydrolase